MAGLIFNETFAPVAKFINIRCFLALGAAMDLEIQQMDVRMAFVKYILEVGIYMDQLEGFVQKGKEDLVYKLKKASYGLKQSPRAWYHYIDSFFINEDFCKSQADHCTSNKKMNTYWWQSST